MKKLLIFVLLVAITLQISNEKGKLKNKLKKQNGYVEEKKDYSQFDNERSCKIRKCIKSTEVYHKITVHGHNSPEVNKFQQECFYNCEVEVCKAKHSSPEGLKKCKLDEDGQEKKKIFDQKDPQFHDYAPSKEELDSYLKVDDEKIIRDYRETHYGAEF